MKGLKCLLKAFILGFWFALLNSVLELHDVLPEHDA